MCNNTGKLPPGAPLFTVDDKKNIKQNQNAPLQGMQCRAVAVVIFRTFEIIIICFLVAI